MLDNTVHHDSVSTLDADQAHKLQQLWNHLILLCGVVDIGSTNQGNASPKLSPGFSQYIKDVPPEVFRHGLWNFILSEDPDALALRFLRARKWDVEKALIMLVSAVKWRDERQLDKTVIFSGESVALKEDPEDDDIGFIAQYRSGKSYVRGTDNENRPIYIIKVRLHDPNMQSAQAMESYVLHNIESIRLMVNPPNDKCCLLFDLTGFGLKNMDFHVVKFLLSVFEARYPETLGLVLIHNAPFVFWGLWSIIKGLLDPVVASKINFTRKTDDLLRYISKENLQASYGGKDNWEYEYIEPQAGEDVKLNDVEVRAAILEEREGLIREFELRTLQWISLDAESFGVSEKQSRRKDVANLIRENYWKLDPYIRARTYHQRVGIVDADGNVNFKAARCAK